MVLGLRFERFAARHLPIYASWFDDPELRRRIEAPTPAWFRYITEEPDVLAWMVYDGDQPVGVMQVDIKPELIAYFGFETNPALRRRGYGRRMLRALAQILDPARVRQLIGEVETDNTASIGCMLSAGFALRSPEPDADGFLTYVYVIEAPPIKHEAEDDDART